MSDASHRGSRLFWASAGGALLLHAALLFGSGELRGGADLKPHLRLIQLMREEPALRTVYAPAYHVVGAVAAPWLGFAAFTRLFALVAAAGLIAGFRSFQRTAGLPDAASALFAWAPYTFALSWCVPKIEAAGYALAFLGLGLLLRRRYLGLALCLVVTFAVHTAAALFLGLGGGILALARRDGRAAAALAAGSVGALPLFAAHLAAGCDAGQALLFSQGDYLRRAGDLGGAARVAQILALASPLALVAAGLGAGSLWRRNRPLAILCAVVVALYLNELWLSPFGAGTTLNLIRGLTLLAFATAIAGGLALAARPRWIAAAIAACAAWAIGATLLVTPASCHVAPIDLAVVSGLSVDRCTFRWRVTRPGPEAPSARRAAQSQ